MGKSIRIIFLLTISASLFYACASPNKTSSKQAVAPATAQTTTTKNIMLQNGIDFFAEGSEPSHWTLQVNYDDTVRFNAEDGLAIKFGYNQLQKKTNNESASFSTTLKNADIQIAVNNKACSVQSQKETYKKEVTFSFNAITYRGCGKFLANESLDGKWKLNKISSASLNIDDYKRIPLFLINLQAETIKGNDGCNNIAGKIEVQGKRIRFFNISTTGIACNKKNIANLITQQISDKLVSYYFKDSKLYLYLPDDSLLEFVKN